MEDMASLMPFRRGAPPFEVTDTQLRRAIRSGDLVVPRRGVLVGRRRVELATTPRDKHALAIGIAVAGTPGPPVYASLGSAALIHQLQRLGQPPQRVRLCRARGGPRRDDEVAVLVCGLPSEHVTVVHGVPLTTRARTTVDLARWVSLRSGVVVADSALRLGSSREEIERVILSCARWPGIRKARRVLALADGRAESALESISRLVLYQAGLPIPDLQVPIGDPHDPDARVDFFWEEFGVVGECDGRIKYEDPEKPFSLWAEKIRQERIETHDLIVVRWNWNDIWRRPEWVVARLREAFAKAQRRRRTA